MPGPAMVPTIFVKAGAAGAVFSPDCQVALTACGYNPDDFGSYKHVQDRIANARKNTQDAQASGAVATPGPAGFDAKSDAFVATSQSGHILQNGRFQGERGNPCSNHYPLYDDDMAPCMPHSSYPPGSAGGARVGTLHHRVGATDRENNEAAAQGDPPRDSSGRPRMTDSQVDAARSDVIDVSLDHHVDNSQQPGSDRKVAKEMKARREAAITAGKAKAAGMSAQIPDEAKRKAVVSNARDIAAECIKAFCDAQLKHMRRENKKNADKNVADAETKRDAAQAEVAAEAGNLAPGQTSEAHERAKKKLSAAEGDVKKAGCMQEQAGRTDASSVRPYQARTPTGTKGATPAQSVAPNEQPEGEDV